MHASSKSNLVFSILILALAIPAMAPAAGLEAIQKRYGGVTDFKASFSQETFQALSGKTVHFEGVVSYKKGSGVRMDVMKPERQVIILKGSTVLVVLPDSGTSQVQDVPPEIAAQNILGFFSGLSSIEEFYSVQKFEDRIVLVPKNGTGSITVWVDKDNLIRRIGLRDAMGNSSDVTIQGYLFNQGIPDSAFGTNAASFEQAGKDKAK